MRKAEFSPFCMLLLCLIVALVRAALSENMSAYALDSPSKNHNTSEGKSSALTWGGSDWSSVADQATAVAVDDGNNIYVAGAIIGEAVLGGDQENEWTIGPGTFLCKVSSDGAVVWVRTWDFIDRNMRCYLATDGAGAVYLSGGFGGVQDLNPGPGADEHTSNGGLDIFLCRLDSDGEFQWATTWGGPGPYGELRGDRVTDMKVTPSGDIAILGEFEGPCDFDPGQDDEIRSSVGPHPDIFLTILDSDGRLEALRTFNVTGMAYPWSLAVDANGFFYIGCGFSGEIDLNEEPDRVIQESAYSPWVEGLICKLTPDTSVEWSSIMLPGYYQLEVNPEGRVLVAGSYYGYSELAQHYGIDGAESSAFLCSFDQDGQRIWTRNWGGFDTRLTPGDMATGPDGQILICGEVVRPSECDRAHYECTDAFLAVFTPEGEAYDDFVLTGPSYDSITSMGVSPDGVVCLVGFFAETLSIPDALLVDDLTAANGQDAFLLRTTFLK